MLSMTSDFDSGTGSPEDDLRAIAEAGFTHVHWCHHWCTDFVYSGCEVEQIGRWFGEYGLELTDLHASAGQEKNWTSPREYERQAGVELVRNRMWMAHALGADVIVLHLPPLSDNGSGQDVWDRVFRSLDDLVSAARRHGVCIAFENSPENGGNFDAIERILAAYGPDFAGLCYDAGHGNMIRDGLDRLDRVKHRLISVHLHDNDGVSDQHKLPFTGTVDWIRLAALIAGSSYGKWVNLETSMRNMDIAEPREFLRQACEAGTRLDALIRQHYNGHDH